MDLSHRYRRLRSTAAIRGLVRQTVLSPSDLIQPIFVQEGVGATVAIESLPGIYRYSLDELMIYLNDVVDAGILGVAIFPVIPEALKTSDCEAALDPDGLVCRTIKSIKDHFPDLFLISDVALDPYNSDGHDGLVKDGVILNDESVELLAKMAVVHAAAGVDCVAPSDMMDGRVSSIRLLLDESGFSAVSILAYSAKYASSLYGPFRDALDSEPKSGTKDTYQMDPANSLEALKEVDQDILEGADMVMVKPALHYLDVVQAVKQHVTIPVAAYHVSGEYAMVHAAAEKGWLDAESSLIEALTAIKRAGADFILSYAALDVAKTLQ